MGICEEGYKGTVCANCDAGYSQNSNFECKLWSKWKR